MIVHGEKITATAWSVAQQTSPSALVLAGLRDLTVAGFGPDRPSVPGLDVVRAAKPDATTQAGLEKDPEDSRSSSFHESDLSPPRRWRGCGVL